MRQQQTKLAIRMVIAGVLIFLVSTFLWFTRVQSNPGNVFWGMVDANLKSFGRTTIISQSDTNRGLEQVQMARLQLGTQDVVVGTTRLVQNAGQENEVAITTETISTPDANYVRYSNVELKNKTLGKDFADLTSVWAKDDKPSAGSSAYVQALFGSLGQVPMGNLNKAQRKELIDYIQAQKVYTIQRSVKDTRDGRPVVIYDMGVPMDRYIMMLKKFDAITGLKQLEGVDPNQFVGQQPMVINFTIDVMTHNLVDFGYPSGTQKETYSGYGAFRRVELPTNTISVTELEQRLQTTLFGQ